MLRTSAFVFALAFPTAGSAQDSWSTFDYQSGNMYNNYSDGQGVTTYGNNIQGGTNWNLRQDYDGSYSGTDSQGNFFYGDQNSGFYSNPGTGTTCIGTGALRTCY
ncbi:hypothetical protein [Citreimonas salinaria]|uniref:Uncharacterized protein n=1 Tax=Citreimonas salinaria TaxID=321339 RepID=A0A1H3MI58_9RHOB|nr:hypothetical protein [Citreimonas salinaria]SDY75869.1 hypothetical protein SAMN05444340_11719 [Citreimonas salinaria]